MNSETQRKSDFFISVVAPVRNAERYVRAFVQEVSALASSHYKDYEIVLVDDSSRDKTVECIRSMQAETPNLQLYCLARRVGLESAFVVGLEHAIGDVMITMDARSDPTSSVMELIDKYHAGHEIVYGLRQDRIKRENASVYQWLARAFYRLYRRLTGEDVPIGVSSLRLLSRRITNAFLENRDRYDLFMVISAFAGFPYTTVRYARINRTGERERIDYVDAVGRAVNTVLLSSKRPLRLMTFASLVGALLSFGYGVYVLVAHLVNDGLAEGWASLSLQISGLFLLQFLTLAIMSEYLIRIFVHSQNRLRYLIVDESSSMVLSRKAELNVASEWPEAALQGDSAGRHEGEESKVAVAPRRR